jgi:RimJ/RimL family protein N-acetyltransferase
MYSGKKVRLRRLQLEDVSKIMKHWNDYELRQYLPSPLPTTEEEMKEYIESENEAFTKRSKFTFGIESLDDNKLVGIVNLTNISWMSRNGEVSTLVILSGEQRGKGYGFDAMIVLLDIAFSVLDLHSVYLWVAGFNERAISFYRKIGFQDQGRLREMVYRNGERHDIVVMDILKPEFLEGYGILPK